MKETESTVVECIKHGKTVVRKDQVNIDMDGNVFRTNNVTIPIIKRGEVVGAVELSQDITSIENAGISKAPGERGKKQSDQNIEDDEITFKDIITVNSSMKESIRKAKIFSEYDNPVLIYGETGTGKELFVRAMVSNSLRDKSRFIAQNCAAIPETLFESILFGTRKGAYTGAKDSKGLFHLADGGVLFLDEINSMPLSLQAKLLRVMQDKKIRPVGSEKEEQVNVKIIAAMNIDPEVAIKNKLIREDLFYRFSSATVRLVPLRERIEDIPVYIKSFIEDYNRTYRKSIRGVSKDLMNFFVNYEWKGNVRELKHIIESTVSIVDEDVIRFSHLPIYMKNKISKQDDSEKDTYESHLSLNDTLEKVERDMIIRALVRTGGKMTESARWLKIPRQTLKSKIDKLGIDIFQYKKK